MAGHSEWQNRKYRKRKVDRKRAKKFTRLSRKIIRAAREGGGDPETNLELKWAIEEARDEDMPSENIERAIKKGTGELNEEGGEAAQYEGYAPGGVAVLVQAFTNNRNRTHANLRQIFQQHDGSLTENGSVAHLFEYRSKFSVPAEQCSEERLLELAVQSGAKDVESNGNQFSILGPSDSFDQIRAQLRKNEIETEAESIVPVPKTEVNASSSEREKISSLVQELKKDLDVQSVYTNLIDS